MNDSYVNVKRFIPYLFSLKKDKGLRALMRGALSSARQSGALSYLEVADCNINILREDHREAALLVMGFVGLDPADKNGEIPFAKALSSIYRNDVNNDEPGLARLRRLLSCRDSSELCVVLRSVLKLILSKTNQGIDYEALLRDLLMFNTRPEYVKAKWTHEYFSKNQPQRAKE